MVLGVDWCTYLYVPLAPGKLVSTSFQKFGLPVTCRWRKWGWAEEFTKMLTKWEVDNESKCSWLNKLCMSLWLLVRRLLSERQAEHPQGFEISQAEVLGTTPINSSFYGAFFILCLSLSGVLYAHLSSWRPLRLENSCTPRLSQMVVTVFLSANR